MYPINYKIQIEPNFDTFTFFGNTVIDIELIIPTRKIILNAVDLHQIACTVKQADAISECQFKHQSERQEIIIDLAADMVGRILLEISFSGKMNSEHVGFYKIRYDNQGEKFLATTQFEAKDARRAFPCFDHPSFKATFDIEFILDRRLTGISNTAIAEELLLLDEKKLVRFQRTVPMSTYLVYFGIGDFNFLEDKSETPLIRVATTPGKLAFADFALQIARKSLEYGQDYTGIDFPMSKCDYIAVPGSNGAMENYGAIRHGEELLLVYPGITSLSKKALIAKIIAHESIHMWFGDLASPADWQDLWLNESFATIFTYEILDNYYPEWKLWQQFLLERVREAMQRDALPGTIPIELPGQLDPNFDPTPTLSTSPIIYNKGAAIIRMLSNYLSKELTQKGIRYFLEKYKFSCATTKDFWNAFETAVQKPIAAFAASWIHQPGYPIISAMRNDRELTLEQTRFCLLPSQDEGVWVLPIEIDLFIKCGKGMRLHLLLKEKNTTIQLPQDVVAFKLNPDQTGFYRVSYQEDNIVELRKLLQDKVLSSIDGYGIQNDIFARVQRGDLSLTFYLDMVKDTFSMEDRQLPLIDIVENLMSLYFVVDKMQNKISIIGRHLVNNQLSQIGIEPQDGDSILTCEMRNILLWAGFLFDSCPAIEFGKNCFRNLLDGKPVHPDILPVVLKIGAATSDSSFDFLLEKATSDQVTDSEKLLALDALGHLGAWNQLASALEVNFNRISHGYRSRMIIATTSNPAARDHMWDWMLEHTLMFEQMDPSQLAKIIVKLVPLFGKGHIQQIESFLFKLGRGNPMVQECIIMALELASVNHRLRN